MNPFKNYTNIGKQLIGVPSAYLLLILCSPILFVAKYISRPEYEVSIIKNVSELIDPIYKWGRTL